MRKRLSRLRATIQALEKQRQVVRNPYIDTLHQLGQRKQTAKPIKSRRRLAKMAMKHEEGFLKQRRFSPVLKSLFLF